MKGSFFLCTIFFVSCSVTLSETVLSVVFFHRHGDRSPYVELPNDTENNKKWGSGAGMLTSKGMRQLYQLGKAFRQRYLLDLQVASTSYNRGEYYVRSTDMDRTIESALSFISGFYPPGTGPEDALPERIQLVPVHTMPMALDSLLLAFKGYQCKRCLELVSEAVQSKAWRDKETENKAVLEKAAKIAGLDPDTVTLLNVSVVADPLFCEREHGMDFLRGFQEDPTIFDTLVGLEEFTLRPLYARNEETQRLSGGNMLGQVIGRFQRAAGMNLTVPVLPKGDTPYLEDGSFSDSVRISHFSAHDTTLISLLGALGIFDDKNPPYASSVVFELVQKDPGSLFVRVYYNKGIGELFASPAVVCPDGEELCPFDTFVSRFQPLVPVDFAAECKHKGKSVEDPKNLKPHDLKENLNNASKESSTGEYAAIGVASSLLLMLILCACGRSSVDAPSLSKYDSIGQAA